MKNQLNRMPEDSCNREVVGGSLWTGEVFGLFISWDFAGLGVDDRGPTGCYDEMN
jgi:hypothetical protein